MVCGYAGDGQAQYSGRVGIDDVVVRLRAAGCVFAEEEAAILQEVAHDQSARGEFANDAAALELLVARRESGEPLEHIVGWVEFCGQRLSVGPGVFIPRQRTALLAAAAISVADSQPHPVVLEMYCGVAPVASSIGRAVERAQLHAADIDPLALEYARRNLPAGSSVYRSDGFSGLPRQLKGTVTVIVAVPPYVPDRADVFMPREAREYEPEWTRLAGLEGLDHVYSLIDNASQWLAPDGEVLIELNRNQHPAAATHAFTAGYSVDKANIRAGGGGSGDAAHELYEDSEDDHTALLRLRWS